MTADPLAATQAVEADSVAAHEVLGQRYEILGLLGAGGMGNVYKARDLELDEIVALKVLRPELVGAPGSLERFRREVKLARRVTHANVARVFDLGEQGGDKIITMEWIDGEALSALLEREAPLPVSRAVELIGAIAAGVGAAHAAGVVHRDLKPDNVLLAKDGRVLVTDFGIARAVATAVTVGSFVGTPAYMAPEQVEGTDAGERADVYALGVMLFEMLTGQLPWRGDSVIAIAAARILRPPPDPREIAPDIATPLAEATLRCMARRPEDRFGSMADVAATLAKVSTPNLRKSMPPAFDPTAPAHASDKRVAVLPFRNLEGTDDYVADGLTEDLIDRLTIARGLRVQSRGVVMRYKAVDRDPRDVGRDLGVQVVVEGSVRKAPGRFRINARAISVDDGFQLWAQKFDGDDADLLATNDRVARAVASALTVDLESSEHVASNADAIDAYLRARALYHRFYAGDSRQSIELFDKALARAPDDPRVIAGWVMGRVRNPLATRDEVGELRRVAERALRLGPSLPDSHMALATIQYHFGEEGEAVRSALRALRIAPSADAHDLLGRILAEVDATKAERHLEAALALEPTLEFAKTALARIHALRGEWDRALGVLDEEVRPQFGARLALWRHDAKTAKEILATVPPADDRPDRPILRVVRVLLEAAAYGKQPPPEFHKLDPTMKPRVNAFRAQIHTELSAARGDVEDAIVALEDCVQSDVFDIAWLDGCPLFDVLRGDPRFAPLREKIASRAARVVEAYERRD
jgi:serine/threonine-protein kinase